ncbi:MAG: sterol desaturase family protein [Deltaproteobacteria bacterium]|nr:sterol desaturase family protein [Deltaproteobacteria bacterium]
MDWLVERLTGAIGHILRSATWQFEGYGWIVLGFFPLVFVVDAILGRKVHPWTPRLAKTVAVTLALYFMNGAVYPILLTGAHRVRDGYVALGIPHLPTSIWEGLPRWAVGLFAIVAYDFSAYWTHRAMHAKWIWPIHAIHHSDPEVIAITTLRVHALEGIFMFLCNVLFLSWLGLPGGVIGVAGVLVNIHNQYVHVNVDWNHGPLQHVLASPRFHRWHHADHPKAHGKNLSNLFPVWDLLFGTYYNPSACRERMGSEGVPENDVVKLMLWPFAEWARMLGRVFRPAKE